MSEAPPRPAALPVPERVLLVLLVCTSALLPLCHTFLPMNDAPSHIATGHIASRLWQGDAFFRAHYSFQSLPLPYWACTLLMLGLEPLLGPLRAFGVVFAAYVIALPLGLRAVLRTAAPGALPLVLLGALASLNWAYWLGEVNFLLGQPLALFALALLLRSTSVRSRAFGGFLLLVPLVYLCHIYAVTALLIAAAGIVAPDVLGWGPLRALPRPSRAQWLGAVYVLLFFGLAAYFVLFQHHTDANRGQVTLGLSVYKLAHVAIDPFDTLRGPAHFMTPLLWLALGAAGGLSLRARWQELAPAAGLSEGTGRISQGQAQGLGRVLGLFHLPLLIPALGLLAVAILGPFAILNPDGTMKEGEISTRFSLLGVLLGLCALRWRWTPQVRALFLAAVVAFGSLKTVESWRIHRAYDAEVRALDRTLLSLVPPHSRLLPLLGIPQPDRGDFVRHRLGSYVVPLREGYSPHVFATLGQHPLRHTRTGDWREVDVLELGADDWAYYDYVLVQTDRPEDQLAQAVPGLTEHAVLLGTQPPFRLYRVGRH